MIRTNTSERGFTQTLVLIVLLLVSISAAVLFFRKPNAESLSTNTTVKNISVTPTPSPTPIAHYEQPVIKNNEAYTIIFIGDSMIDAFGSNFDYLRLDLKKQYPNTVFGLFNYGYGSTSILTLNERLNNDTTYNGKTNEAIFKRALDIIIIGSFGHNPLSNLPLDEGLKKQTEALDSAVLQLVTQRPGTLIVFLADLAPSEKYYGKGVVTLNQEQRSAWVTERKAYIENHINYATSHNIPLINIYKDGMLKGDVNINYINKDDYIHPSSTGLIFMSQEIADFLYKNNILPK